MNVKVCVVGSFMMDLVASAPRRPMSGETVIGTDFGTFLGGKGFNQAVAAARAGADTALIGRIGDDEFGREFRATLHSEGIDDSAVVTDSAHGTGVGLPILEPDGQNSIVVVPRANWAVDAVQIREHADVIVEADVLLLQLELPLAGIAEACRIARSAGTTVVLNPAPYAPIDPLRGLVDVLVPNEVELLSLAGLDADSDSDVDVDVAVQKARDSWSADIVATLGGAGAIVLSHHGPATGIAPVPVTAVDTIGAGDTFCGYLAEALASGASLTDAATRANAAAAVAVTRRGAADSAPRRHEIEVAHSHSTDQGVRDQRQNPSPVRTTSS